MVEVIPSINHSDPEELRRRIRQVEPYVRWVHVDVSDGIFASVKIFNDPSALYNFFTPLNIELHLMIEKPEEHLDAWLKTGARRLLVHIESTNSFAMIRRRVLRAEREIGAALHPATSPEAYDAYAELTNYVLVLGVTPGPSGQKMQPHCINTVMHLRERHPKCIIEVDGGVSIIKGTAHKLVAAGANNLCVGHEIFSSGDIAATIEAFRTL